MEDHCGYLIVLARISDPERFRHYVRALPSVFQKFGGRYLAVCPAAQVQAYGADAPAISMMISVWPSLQRVEQFWHSADYRTISELRAGSGEFHALALDGEPAEQSAAAVVLGLEPGEPLESEASQAVFSDGALRIIASAGPGEGVVLEGQRAALGVVLATAGSMEGARAALAALPRSAPLRALLAPGLRSAG